MEERVKQRENKPEKIFKKIRELVFFILTPYFIEVVEKNMEMPGAMCVGKESLLMSFLDERKGKSNRENDADGNHDEERKR